MESPTRQREFEGEDQPQVWGVHEDDDIRLVTAARVRNQPEWPWSVSVGVAEFLREEPLQSDFADAVSAGLKSVRGVRKVVQEDREVWLVSGRLISGKKLVIAVDKALEILDASMRQHVESIPTDEQ